MENYVNFEYTKINKIYEVNNDMVHNYYYIYYGRIYNKEHTRYRKFKYVEWFDIQDVMEYFDKDVNEYVKNSHDNIMNYLLNEVLFNYEGANEIIDDNISDYLYRDCVKEGVGYDNKD